MDYVYLFTGLIVFICSCYGQYKIARSCKKYQYALPLLYAGLTFFIGLLSLLISFILIFIAQFADVSEGQSHQSETFHGYDN